MNTKSYLFIASFLLCSFFSSAQSEFRTGFIITLEKDTIHGNVALRSNQKNYESCLFKNGEGDKEYGPDEILGYGFKGDKFFTSQIEDGYFSEAQVTGLMSLYRGYDKYFIKKDTTISVLESREELIMKDGKVGLAERSRWRGIINYLVGDCLEARQINLNSLRLSDVSLTKLAVKYNKCRNASYREYGDNKKWIKLNFGLALGIAKSKINVDDQSGTNSFNYDHLAEEYSSTNPSLGVVISLTSPRISERAYFQTEFHYLKSSYSSTLQIDGATSQTTYDTFISLSTLSIPFSFRYDLGTGSWLPYIQLGFNYDLHLKTEANTIGEENDGNTINTSEFESFLVRGSQIGVWGGIGLDRRFEKFQAGLSLRYFMMDQLELSSNLNVDINRIALNLIILIK